MHLPGLQIVSELARGGMGVVYRAIEAEAGRDVAVKMMQPALSDDAEVRERFAQEARAMGALDHPGILPVYRVGDHHGLPYFTMKLAEGGTLAQRRARLANDWRGIAKLVVHLADAVHHAHQRGLLHRDLKPQNILFDGDQRAYVSDFGLVKMAGVDSSLTRSVSVLGTPHYMAPEVAQRDARAASVASDVWSLGAILYEVLAQRLAFQAEGVPALLKKIVDEEPLPLTSVPRDLATITFKCLRKEPAQRYASAKELGEDLQRWLNGEPISARQTGLAGRFLTWCRRKPALAGLSLLLGLSVIIGSAMVLEKSQELSVALRRSLANEVHSVRLGVRVHEREQALLAVRQAARLGSTPELEADAASVLAMPSVTFAHEIRDVAKPELLVLNESFTLAADFRSTEAVIVRELPSLRELVRLEPGASAMHGRSCFASNDALVVYRASSDDHLVAVDWRSQHRVVDLPKEALQPHLPPDGTKLAIALGGRVQVHDLTKPGSPPVAWALELGDRTLANISPDGRWIALGEPDRMSLSVHDLMTGKPVDEVSYHAGLTISAMMWCADSTSMLVGHDSGAVRSWMAGRSSKASRTLPALRAQIFGLAVDPSMQLAAVSSYDATTELLDWPSGRKVGEITGNSFCTRFRADGRQLVVHSEGLAAWQIWNVQTSDVCRQMVRPESASGLIKPKGGWCGEISADGRLLAIAGQQISIFDVSGGQCIGSLPDANSNTLMWLSQTNELWFASDSTAKLMRWAFTETTPGVMTAKLTGSIDLAGMRPLRMAAAEKADRWALTTDAGLFHGRISETSGTFVASPASFGSPALNPVALSPDGRFIFVSGDSAPMAGVYDIEQARWVTSLSIPALSAGRFTNDGQSLWIGTVGDLRRLDCRHWKETPPIRDRRQPGSLDLLAMHPQQPFMFTLDGTSEMVLRETESGSPLLRLQHPIPSPAVWTSFSADGRWLVFTAYGYLSQVWDLAKLQREFSKLGLPWRGPHFADATDPKPVSRLVIE